MDQPHGPEARTRPNSPLWLDHELPAELVAVESVNERELPSGWPQPAPQLEWRVASLAFG